MRTAQQPGQIPGQAQYSGTFGNVPRSFCVLTQLFCASIRVQKTAQLAPGLLASYARLLLYYLEILRGSEQVVIIFSDVA